MLLKNKFVENKKKRKYKTAKATAGNIGGGTALLANSHNTTISSHHNTRRFSHQRHQQQNIDQQQQQQQVQVQVQQQQIQIHQHQHQHHSPARSPLAALSSVAIRNTNELGVTTTTPTTTTTTNEVCDNSNDSGLGIEDRQQHQSNTSWNNGAIGEEDSKRRKMDIKLESEDANFTFPDVTKSGGSSRTDNKIIRNTNVNTTRTNNNGSVGRVIGVTRPRSSLGVYGKRPSTTHQGPITLTSQLSSISRDGKIQLQIMCQPEQQHRARYQTEGSRGAVKDRTGNGFPTVRLLGYDKPTSLQVFIGTDLGRVAPHMFYQACRVSGKNSTPCIEKKFDGTIVIEVDMEPTKDMLVTCDCVGILKERNVDVEHRFPQEANLLQGRSKKKSTRCRMVFRTPITNSDGTIETLQVCSQPIVCTQPPGIPEISKKSLTSSPCTGGLELFILGKNFLKDTRIVFQIDNEVTNNVLEQHWECSVIPDKEFLQQTHLVCIVPPYRRQDLSLNETICVKLYAISSGKTSEPHNFFYTAASTPPGPTIGKIETIGTANNNNNNNNNSNNNNNNNNDNSTTLTPSNVTTNFLTNLSSQLSTSSSTVQSPTHQSTTTTATTTDILTNNNDSTTTTTTTTPPSPQLPPVVVTNQVAPLMLWTNQTTPATPATPATKTTTTTPELSTNCQNTTTDIMMPPPSTTQQNNIITNTLLNRRSSINQQSLIITDNLKSELLDDNSESSMISDTSIQSISTTSSNGNSNTSPMHQLVNDIDVTIDTTNQNNLLRSVTSLQAKDTNVGLLNVVDIINNQHSPPSSSTTTTTLHEQTQVKILNNNSNTNNNNNNNNNINSDITSPILTNDNVTNTALSGVVDLRMKQHEYDTLTNFTTTPVGQPLPNQSSQCIEKYLNHIESSIESTNKTNNNNNNNNSNNNSTNNNNNNNNNHQDNNYVVDTIQQRASIISSTREQQQQQQDNLLAPNQATVKLDELVNSTVDSHQMVQSMDTITTNTNSPLSNVDTMINTQQQQQQQQQNNHSNSPIPILEVLLPTPMVTSNNDTLTSSTNDVTTDNNNLLTTINVGLHTTMQDNNGTNVNDLLQVTNEPIQQIPMSQQDVVMQQQVQVEQVVAHAQQQVEQVVAQVQQQAAHTVQQAQQQVFHQVYQHTQVVQQAVQQVQAAQQVHSVPAVQQAVQQATNEVVQQAVQQATHEVVQQVQAVQQAVQQAQAAQAMQQAVQQDIGSMLNQPAGFVAEASSALANGASQEPSQQRLTNAAEQAITDVITNATQDIINNRPLSTTTAQAIIATKNILNSVATQSAQLMNNAMNEILPKSPSNNGTSIVEQVSRKSSPITIPVTTNHHVVNDNNNITNTVSTTNVQIQNVGRKTDDSGTMLPQELTSMSEHDLLSYINPSCFDQGSFLM